MKWDEGVLGYSGSGVCLLSFEYLFHYSLAVNSQAHYFTIFEPESSQL